MAVSSTIEYCTDRDLQDVYPHIAEYDLKRRLYNWVDLTGDKYVSYNSGLVTVLFANGTDRGTTAITVHTDVDADFEWFYDSGTDSVYYHDSVTNPNAQVMEAGDDWATITERMRRKASRLVESRLDYRMSREVVKDREGSYPAIIVHATALQAVIILLKSHDPTNEIIAPFQDEYDEIIEGLSAGTIVLPTAISGDSSKGVIREVSVDAGSDLRPIELKGHYNGTGYELLKVIVDSDAEDSVIGTATFSVYAKDSDTLKTDQIVTKEKINGDFQSLGVGNLYIRWGGDDSATAKADIDDEYEIELWGSSLDSTISSVGSVKMTRR
jgi:hypothetical protein